MSEAGKTEVLEIEVKLPVKEKKARSEAQKEATVKAMAALKAKREAAAKEQAELADAKVLAKEKIKAHKKREPGAEIVTRKDLDGFMGEIKGMLSSRVPEVEKPVEKAVVKEVVKAVEKPVMKHVVSAAPAKKQTGHELLDTLFNLK